MQLTDVARQAQILQATIARTTSKHARMCGGGAARVPLGMFMTGGVRADGTTKVARCVRACDLAHRTDSSIMFMY